MLKTVNFKTWQESVSELLDSANFAGILADCGKQTVLLKPNLVSNDPPPMLLAASDDPVAIDAWGAGILGFDWQCIGHIKMADGVLGQVEK